jgi:hypothetical protein
MWNLSTTDEYIQLYRLLNLFTTQNYILHTYKKKERCSCNKTREGMGTCIPGLLCGGCTVSEETEVLLG